MGMEGMTGADWAATALIGAWPAVPALVKIKRLSVCHVAVHCCPLLSTYIIHAHVVDAGTGPP